MRIYFRILDDRIVGAAAATSPGPGWVAAASLSELIDRSRRNKRPLFLRPGIYPSSPIDIVASAGERRLPSITAEAGTVTILLSEAGPYLLKTDIDVTLTGLVFDGGRLVLTDTTPTAGLIRITGTRVVNFAVSNCEVRNAKAAGISTDDGVTGRITDTRVHRCRSGIFSLDSRLVVDRNRIEACEDNGIQVWNGRVAANGSEITLNHIAGIASASGGTGQYGNGIVVFRACGVKVMDNTVADCSYSAIRLNAAGDCHVVRNHCSRAREVAVFVEAPITGLDLDGGIVAENIITVAGSGIQVANSGLYGDGRARRVTVANNQVSRLIRTFIPEEKAFTAAIGIIVEGSCNVVGNSVENAAVAGVMAGTNNAATDIVVAGNYVHACPMGIGYSANAAAAGVLIASNLVSEYTVSNDPASASYPHSGAIVSASFTGTDYRRDAVDGAANVDYGNSAPTTVGPLTVGMNKAR